ncbi:MAG: TIGR02444 family protein [Alphaproteobacteria bacterium]
MTGFPDHPFWDFSLRVYGSEGVAPACLELQEAHGIDVNVLLVCCWLGASGRGAVGAEDIAQIVEAASTWHGEIVRGLRAVRTRLKEPVAGEDRDLALSIRKQVQKTEIDAEHIEQLMLAAATEALPDAAPGDPAEDARANAEAYFTQQHISLDDEDRAALQTIVAAAVGSPSDRD